MTISDGQLANAANLNNAFASKTGNNTLTGKQTLNRSGSGSQVDDAQQAINDLQTAIDVAEETIISLQEAIAAMGETVTSIGIDGDETKLTGDVDLEPGNSIDLTRNGQKISVDLNLQDNLIINRKLYTPTHPVNNNGWSSFSADNIWAASFICKTSEDYNWGDAWLYKTDSPNFTAIRMEIREDDNLSPGDVLGYADVLIAAITTDTELSATETGFAFDPEIPLVAGTRYWITIRPIGAAGGGLVYSYCGAAIENECYTARSQNGGSTWVIGDQVMPAISTGGDSQDYFIFGFSEAFIKTDWLGKIPVRVLPEQMPDYSEASEGDILAIESGVPAWKASTSYFPGGW
jgi:hypothetical protein